MSTQDDRLGGAGRYPEDHTFQNAPAGARAGDQQGVSAPTTQIRTGSGAYDSVDADYTDAAPGAFDQQRGVDFYDDVDRGARWHGGADLGLLILRLALGVILGLHGAQKLFGVLGGPGTDGFAESLTTMGFEQTAILSLVTGAAELGGGALLVLGLFTPLGAAGIAGVMGPAIALNAQSGFFASDGGVEFEVMLLAAAVALMFTGPGRASLDNGRAWYRRPLLSGFLCLLLAAGSAAAVFFLLR